MDHRFSPRPAPFRLFTASLACFGWGIVVPTVILRADTIYVTDSSDNTVLRYDLLGNGSVFASSGLDTPNGIAVDGSGNIYVSNAPIFGSQTVTRFTPSAVGSQFATGPVSGSGNNGLAFDASGNLFVATDGGVDKITPDGTRTSFATLSGGGAQDLEFDSGGNLIVVQYGASKVVSITPGGSVTDLITTGLNGPRSIAISNSGLIYIGNMNDNTVVRFSAVGVNLGVFANSGLLAPTGLAFDSQSNLYAVNNGNGTSSGIEKFDPEGNATLFADTEGARLVNLFIVAAVPEASTWTAMVFLGAAAGWGFWRNRRVIGTSANG
jgi:sugar lactone lactonase YvrE